MPTPRTSIDDLPAKDPPEADDRLVIQDSGVTKHTTVGGLLTLPSSALTAHINNPTNAHDASAISSVDAGNGVNGANVQAQLGQLSGAATNASSAAAAADAKIVTHMAAALDAHDASAISAIAGAILTGLDVQAQLTQIEAALSGGTVGPEGPEGPAGPGVPTGGTAGQLLSKIDANDFSSQWISPLWLPLTGGRVTESLEIVAALEALRLGRAAVNGNPHVGFYDETFANRHGYLMGGPVDMRLVSTAGNVGLYPNNTKAMELTSNGIICSPGWAVYADTFRSSGQSRFATGTSLWGTGTAAAPNAILQLHGAGVDPANVGARSGYIGFPTSSILYVNNELASGTIQLRTDTFINGVVNGTETWRALYNAWLVGKTAANNYSTVDGVELWTSGQGFFTTAAVSATVFVVHIGAADANAIHFQRFQRGATVIGSISQTSTTGVAYNTTSDERLKTFTRDVDDDEALEKVRAMRPLHFTWNEAPGDGEQIGFFAQELIEVAPEAVTIGEGEPGDVPDEDGNGGFVPWGTDLSKLVPRIVAAMQAMDNKFAAMRTEITDLRAEVAELRHGRKK